MSPAGLGVQIFRQLLKEGLLNPSLFLVVLFSAALTILLSRTGVDAAVNELARLQDPALSVAWSAFPMLAGIAVPVLVPLICLTYGKYHLAAATASALLTALFWVSVLKGLTSRVHPDALQPKSLLARSQTFDIGLFQSGLASVVEGWPSGHAATNGAVAIVLARLTKSHKLAAACSAWVAWVSLATAFGISGDVHWLSDTVSGLLLALVISSRTVTSYNRYK